MADGLIPGIDTAAIGQAAHSGGLAATTFALYAMIILGCLAIIGIILYKKTFNIKIEIIDNTKGGIVIRKDFQGKLTQKRPGEFRFQIWKAKQSKLRYNEESFSQDDLYFEVGKNNKLTRKLYMTFDSEGQLVPVRISSMTSRVPVIDEATKNQVFKDGVPVYKESSSIKADVKQVDIAWYYKEYDKSGEVFDARGFWDKNGFLILVITLIITLGVFGYTAYKLSETADKMSDVVSAQGGLIEAIERAHAGNASAVVSGSNGGFAIPGVTK